MAMTFQEDFEGANGTALTSANTGFATIENSVVFSTTIKKAGTASARFISSGSFCFATRTFAATSVRHWSFYIYPTASPSANTAIFFAGTSNAQADRLFQVVFNTTRTVKVQQGSAAIIVGSNTSSVCPLNEWSRIDVSYVNGELTLSLYPGTANCDLAAGTATAGNTTGGAITNQAISYIYIGVGNASNNNFYVDVLREDDAAIPGPLAVSGGAAPYLYYDNGTAWVDVTENLWYDNGTSWFEIEGDAVSSGG